MGLAEMSQRALKALQEGASEGLEGLNKLNDALPNGSPLNWKHRTIPGHISYSHKIGGSRDFSPLHSIYLRQTV